jgi:hypothetical protein
MGRGDDGNGRVGGEFGLTDIKNRTQMTQMLRNTDLRGFFIKT